VEDAKFTATHASTSSKQCQINFEGIVHKEFVPTGQTMQGGRLRENDRRRCPVKKRNNFWALSHDNVPAHTSLLVLQLLASTKATITPQLPYSADLAHCNFFSYSRMKLKLKGRRFERA
jgi:hypothetical protein